MANARTMLACAAHVSIARSQQGMDLSSALWSAALLDTHPSLIRETHLAYCRAGADVVTTASYQASFEGFLVSRPARGFKQSLADSS